MTTTVTDAMRSAGWNVHILAASSRVHFAGLLQSSRDDKTSEYLTFRDVLSELRLCFDIPTEDNPWDNLGFAFEGVWPPAETDGEDSNESDTEAGPSYPQLVSHHGLDQPVCAPPPPPRSVESENRPAVRYRLVQHRQTCHLSAAEPLASHIKAGCASHITHPVPRRDPRYLPPKKSSTDPRVFYMPFRKRIRARGSQSPSKRSESGTSSPSKGMNNDDSANGGGADVANLIAPPEMEMGVTTSFARQTIDGFRPSCLTESRVCAVTGQGRPWCNYQSVGPALQACHIVPQHHYHLYPDPEDVDNDDFDTRFGPNRLQEAWRRTWSSSNGIILLSHLHELFDARLFSIHPDTHRVRAFVPYDVITGCHGRKAKLSTSVDTDALRHHYDMCCIENMGAKLRPMDLVTDSGLTTAGAASSQIISNPDTPSLPRPSDSAGHVQDEPSKHSRMAYNGSRRQAENDDGSTLSPTHGGETNEENAMDPNQCRKRKGMQEFDQRASAGGETYDSSAGWRSSDEYYGYWSSKRVFYGVVTPQNSEQFLADVKYNLLKILPSLENRKDDV
ncbi:hypothetical protein TOPH_06834 [Tolypocladium ophioglossoides CBS 100239]|uniref:HNH nuclease domain-containing protein n=1 Tax=Tolypocladium ophioglossoides (strain CBS 100239) TaxID=1163406 RepID=A0A0L0N3R4_TOLOC|nr:hypothetical protein TOPH_06834 [Tolypocladium ophioglossoides CBS 100239]